MRGQTKDAHAVERLGRELAALATSGHAAFRRLVLGRQALLPRLSQALEISTMRESSASANKAASAGAVSAALPAAMSAPSGPVPAGLDGLLMFVMKALQTFLQDAACKDAELGERVLAQVMQPSPASCCAFLRHFGHLRTKRSRVSWD